MKVEILIGDISNIVTKTRHAEHGLITTVAFEARINPALIARILNLQRQGAPLLMAISSPQATMDLVIEEYRDQPEAEEKGQKHTKGML